MYVAIIVVGSVPLSVMCMSMSVIGSVSSMYCRKLLCIVSATPAVYPFLPRSPLQNKVYCFLDSFVFWFTLVSCNATIFMLQFFHPLFHFIPYSRFLCDLMLIVAMLKLVPRLDFTFDFNFSFGVSGSCAVASFFRWIVFLCLCSAAAQCSPLFSFLIF